MENILWYVKQFGKFTFQEKAFNEVDNLVFCALPYIEIEKFYQINEYLSLQELYLKYQSSNYKENIFEENEFKLLKLLSESKRFKNVILSNYVNEVSKEEKKQFGAITFRFDNKLFIAFKGTDATILGWKEVFNMSYMNVIPAQKRALEYLENILNNHPNDCYIGGHSKGGNLAMSAYLFCNDLLKSRIIKVYNNDGPGLKESLRDEKSKIITFIPTASIIGNIFVNNTKIILIESKGIGIFQHDLYSWLVEGNHFIYQKEMDYSTKELANFLNQIILKLPNDQKEKIVQFIYDFLAFLKIDNIEDSMQNILDNSLLLKEYNIVEEDLEILKQIMQIVKNIIK